MLHRGIYPSQGVRYALSFSMMPAMALQTRDDFMRSFRLADSFMIEGHDVPPYYAF